MSTSIEMLTQITLAQLERTSKDWDKKTKNILLFISGAGNMFGGGGKGYFLKLHGENSIYPTGKIDVMGVFSETYNVARGQNGPNSGSISYFKDAVDLDAIDRNKPTFKIDVAGSCDTGRDTLCTLLSASMDWIRK